LAHTGESEYERLAGSKDRANRKEIRVHAVVAKVTIKNREAAEKVLREQIVPRVSQAPGFVHGYWTRKDDQGLAMVVFESEDAATVISQQVPNMVTADVTLESVEVREVVAHA
jgi:hypothetical protein